MAQVVDTLDTLSNGSRVWVLSDDGLWQDGVLRSKTDSTCEVQLGDGKLESYNASKVQPANPDFLDGNADLCQLSYLNEPSVLHDLSHRYQQDQIYTFAGPVLIAMNPCKALPLYTPEVAARYSGAGRKDLQYASSISTSSSEPHIFLVAAQAFAAMVRENASQSLVVSGESGAGKTETTKRAMQYFANLAGGDGIEDRVMETNPILEAFGNAKTLRNHNSSRFGKLIEIYFNHTHHICGAGIRTYLLEKSRVVNQLQGERSYHIFYQLVAGASPEDRERYKLPATAEEFVYLSKSGCTVIPSMDDAAEFQDTKRAALRVGLTETQLDQLLAMVSGVMWLGNLAFKSEGDEGSALEEGPALEAACQLLGTSPEALGRALTKRQIKTGRDVVEASNTPAVAAEVRDALAKAIYAALFDWIVEQINGKLSAGRRSAGLAISILDIFGFEDFAFNSFEQLCINFTNERLQALFNRHIFTLQQQEYEAEGVGHVQINFEDNTPTVDLIDAMPPKGVGLLALMDGQCRMPRSSDESLLQEMKKISVAAHRISFNPRKQTDFSIEHFAGKVTYSTTGMLDKNKDTISPDLVELIVGSSQALLAEVGRSLTEAAADPRRSKQTVGLRFSNSLKELLAALEGTGLHFVRCIKPNSALSPSVFTQAMVLNQLRCCGVLEVVKMAKAGFPSRMPIEAFVKRYTVLLPDMQGKRDDETYVQAAQRLFGSFGVAAEQYLVGRTKIFFKPGVIGVVDDKWALFMRLAQVVQSSIRCWHWRTWFQKERRAAIAVQTAIRGRLARRGYEDLARKDRAARKLQRAWRSAKLRSNFRRVKNAAVTMQMFVRRWCFQRRVRRRRHEKERLALIEQLEKERLAEIEQQRLAALAADEAAQKQANGDAASHQEVPQQPVDGLQAQYGMGAADVEAAMKVYAALQAGGPEAVAALVSSKAVAPTVSGGDAKDTDAAVKVKLQNIVLRQQLQLNASLRSKYMAAAAAAKPDDAMQKLLLEKEQKIAELQRKVADLEARVGGDDRSVGSAADAARAERTAAAAAAGKNTGILHVDVLKTDFQEVSEVLEDNLQFLGEVGASEGTQQEGMKPVAEPMAELSKLTGQFTVWKRDFKAKLAGCKELLMKRSGRDSVRDIASKFGQMSVNRREVPQSASSRRMSAPDTSR